MDAFKALAANRLACCPSLAHRAHFHIHKPLKLVSALTYIAGAALEHWTVFGVAASVFIAAHVTTWVLAE